jgi:crotonobetainyl-CoA:carnitine CoA-transferase CaiB-like acyl-CoA transferase
LQPSAFRPLERLRAHLIHCRYLYLDHILSFDVYTSFGKKNTYMDLRSDSDRARALELVRESDVFVQGFRSGSFARRGFGSDDLRTDTWPRSR